jgi:hypothetical protein
MVQWKCFNEQKHDSAFAYISEIIKRAQTDGFNRITIRKNYTSDITPEFYRLDSFTNDGRYVNKKES